MRVRNGFLALVACAAVTSTADAATKVPLRVVSATGAHSSAPSGSAGRLNVRVRSTTTKTHPAFITVSLRRPGHTAKTLIASGRTARASHAKKGTLVKLKVRYGKVKKTATFQVVVCVRIGRGAKATCRVSRKIKLLAPSSSSLAPVAPKPAATTTTPAAVTTTPPATTTTATPPTPPSSDPATLPVAKSCAVTPTSGGDCLFPTLGNGGIDVQHYDLDLTYRVVTQTLSGTATLTVLATDALPSFNLDFHGPTVSAVKVNGTAATFSSHDTKLAITPATAIAKGATFTVAVTYSGTPDTITDPDGSPDGWQTLLQGAWVASEPQGAEGWFPDNNIPSDKATYDMKMTVPKTYKVTGNGLLVSNATSASDATQNTWEWKEDKPMSTYLATMSIGVGQVAETAAGTDGVPALYDFVDADDAALNVAMGSVADEPNILKNEVSWYGTFPFENAGSIVLQNVQAGYALETQTKPIYPLAPDETTVVHELSHQWYGDSLGVANWSEIWLNEGFATWTEWYYGEKVSGGATAKSQMESVMSTTTDGFWAIPPADPPTAADIFSSSVYQRGGACLEALHEIIGDDKMLLLMKTWAADHAYGSVSTPQFVALAQQITGLNLVPFFRDWLYDPDKPDTYTASKL